MLVTLKEYAAKVGRSPVTIRQRCQRGTLPATKVGRDWLIEEDEPFVDKRFSSGNYTNWRQKHSSPQKKEEKR
jgi:hypothetical protein